MTERFTKNNGTITIGTGDTTIVGTSTTFAGVDHAGAAVIAYPADVPPVRVGTVAEGSPRGTYDNLALPLVTAYTGSPLTNCNYELVDGLALASGATQAAIFARFSAFLEQNMGLVGNTADTIDYALVPNNTLFIDAVTAKIYQWRDGVLNQVTVSSSDNATNTYKLWVPAHAMTARTTNGAAAGSVEMSTNKNMVVSKDFDPSTAQYAQFKFVMPDGWDGTGVGFIPVWSHPATTTNFGVMFSMAAVAIADGAALDVAFGTAQTSIDTGGTTDTQYIGPRSADVTPAGSPVVGSLVQFQIGRVPADASDTLAVNARLHGVFLYFRVPKTPPYLAFFLALNSELLGVI